MGILRIFHWGPLIALAIIKSITLMTLYMNSMLWPPHLTLGGFLNQSLFLFLSAMTLLNFIMAILQGPAYVPFGWKPKKRQSEEFLQYCNICEGFKTPRSHHCRKCNRCVIKMDHHCPWINNCVGWANHAHFTCFLGFAVLGCFQASILLIAAVYRGLHTDRYVYRGGGRYATSSVHLTMWSLVLTVLNIGLSIGVIIAVGMLLFFQLRSIFYNRTGIEEWILEKAKHRRGEKNETFIYPYDLGYLRNIKQVLNFSCSPVGDGIIWPIAEGCDQFTLTREQLAQKAEKRARTMTYIVVKRATGSWIPFWSQGFRVCLNPPCTDEPRIKLEVNDVVKVTRWRKHWLFGEKELNSNSVKLENCNNGTKDGSGDSNTITENKKKNKNEKEFIRIRGWFPRKCALELVDEDYNEYKRHINNKKDK